MREAPPILAESKSSSPFPFWVWNKNMAPLKSLQQDYPLIDSSFQAFCASHDIFSGNFHPLLLRFPNLSTFTYIWCSNLWRRLLRPWKPLLILIHFPHLFPLCYALANFFFQCFHLSGRFHTVWYWCVDCFRG